MSAVMGTLSMCRKAGKLILGMDEVKNTVRKREARLVLLTSDLSEKSRREMEFLCGRFGTQILTLTDTMLDLADGVGKRCGILCVTDKGFADSIRKKLGTQSKI